MTVKREILFIILCVLGAALLSGLLPDFSGKVTVVIGILIIIMTIYYYQDIKKFKKVVKAETITDRVVISPTVTSADFTDADLKRLRKVRNGKLASIAIVFLVPFAIFQVFSHFFFPKFFPEAGGLLAWVLTVGIGGLGVVYFYKRFVKFNRQLREGKKTVVVGYVLAKEVYNSDSHEYLLHIEGYEVIVNWHLFEKYAKGDAIEVHLFEPWKNLLLFERKM